MRAVVLAANDRRRAAGLGQWVGGLEAILGVPPKAGKFEKYGQTSLAGDLNWEELDLAEDTDRTFAQALRSRRSLDGFPWLNGRRVDQRGAGILPLGAGLRTGVRARRLRSAGRKPALGAAGLGRSWVLAEFDPWWQLLDKPAEALKTHKRDAVLALPRSSVTLPRRTAAPVWTRRSTWFRC